MAGDMVLVSDRQLSQRVAAPRREAQYVFGTLKPLPRFGMLFSRRLLDYHVCIRSSEPKAAQAGDPPPDLWPGRERAWDCDPCCLQGDARIELLQVELTGNFGVLKTKHHLDQSSHTGGVFQMADVCLYG